MSRALWEQLQGEPDNAYQAFELYRDMGAPRVSPDRFGLLWGLSPGDAYAWFARWQWAHRAAAYDVAFERGRREHLEAWAAETTTSAEAKDLQILGTAREVITTEITKLLRQSKRANYPLMKPRELGMLMKHTIELARLVRGQTTSITPGLEHDNTDSMTDEELIDYDRLARKANGAP